MNCDPRSVARNVPCFGPARLGPYEFVGDDDAKPAMQTAGGARRFPFARGFV
jgi:hypothetical protein